MITMPRSGTLLRICLVWISLIAGDLALAAPPEADKITKEELLPLLGKPDVTIIDLRFGREWYDSNLKIKCTVREDPMKPGSVDGQVPKRQNAGPLLRLTGRWNQRQFGAGHEDAGLHQGLLFEGRLG